MTICIRRINIIVIILPVTCPCVIRRVDVDAVHLSGIKILQQLKGMIIICLNQSMPKITVRSVTNSVDWFQVWVNWLSKFSNRDKIIDRELYRFCLAALYANSFSIFDLQHLVEVTDISSLKRSLDAPTNGNIIKGCTFRKMLFENKAKLLLLGKLVYFFLNSIPKIRIGNLSDEIIYRSHKDFSLFVILVVGRFSNKMISILFGLDQKSAFFILHILVYEKNLFGLPDEIHFVIIIPFSIMDMQLKNRFRRNIHWQDIVIKRHGTTISSCTVIPGNTDMNIIFTIIKSNSNIPHYQCLCTGVIYIKEKLI